MRIVVRTTPEAHEAVLRQLGDPAKWGQQIEPLTVEEYNAAHDARIAAKAKEFHDGQKTEPDRRVAPMSVYEVVNMSRVHGVPADRNVLVYDYEVPEADADAFEGTAKALDGFIDTKRV